jgi:hypothetical protein
MSSKVLKFKTGKIRWLVYGLGIFICPLIALAVKDGEIQLAAIFIFIFGVPLSLLYIYCAEVTLTERSISLIYPFGSYQMQWDEVEFFAAGHGNLKLYNNHKSITFPGSELWTGPDKNEAMEFINKKLSKNNCKQGQVGKALVPTFFGSKDA